MRCALIRWLEGVSILKNIAIPRQYVPFDVKWTDILSEIELHAFGDASLKGYGACVYLRCSLPSGEVSCTLIRSCARVAPLERKTLPRLELLGCLVTAQLVQNVIRSLQLPSDVKFTCWSDSMVALGWIQGSPSKWKPWVANRVASIQSLTNPEKWKHVAGIENPADLVTRGVCAEKLVESDLWWHGPAVLRSVDVGVGSATSPQIILPQNVPEVEAERKATGCESLLVCSEVHYMFDVSRWSTLNRAYRVIAYVLRFVNSLKKNKIKGDLTEDELSAARGTFVKLIQFEHFRKEIELLKAKKNIPLDSKLIKLSPFVDVDGILRVKGRVQLSELSYESKHPIILPKCHGSLLLVRFTHSFQNHAGVDTMITFIRKDYEIFGLRNMAKSVKKSCVFCQKCDVRACNEVAAPLPRVRVTSAPVFSVTGIDFAGPVFCLDDPEKKFYICLFVCGVVRAVHMELVPSLSSEDFIMAFRKFAALKRVPSIVYTDNGTNFVGGKNILNSYLGPLAPEWRFTCPRSPWWGGWWERLVRTVKSALKKTIGRRCLFRVEMETCLHEVSASVNSRPLTFVGSEVENKLPLTPNHFLAGQGNQGLENRVAEDPESVSTESLSLRHQEMIERQNEFWQVWSSDYIRNLPASFQKFKKQGNLKEGSVVLVKEDNLPRTKWLLGVVERLHIGKDGVPRASLK